MTKKPVKIWQVLLCLLLVLGLAATLFLPIFSLKLDITARGASEYVYVTGLDIIQMIFGMTDYVTASDGAKELFIFLGRGGIDISQYVNPVYIWVVIYTYVVCIAVVALAFVFIIFNFAGIRLSVFNVFSGLIVMLCGIVTSLCIVLQNAEAVTSVALSYNFNLAIGGILIMVLGFLYMMFAPKKKV